MGSTRDEYAQCAKVTVDVAGLHWAVVVALAVGRAVVGRARSSPTARSLEPRDVRAPRLRLMGGRLGLRVHAPHARLIVQASAP
jgi:hypothetical protein